MVLAITGLTSAKLANRLMASRNSTEKGGACTTPKRNHRETASDNGDQKPFKHNGFVPPTKSASEEKQP
jgi:hypothetical protein